MVRPARAGAIGNDWESKNLAMLREGEIGRVRMSGANGHSDLKSVDLEIRPIQVRLAEADVADQDDVGLGCDGGQTEQVLDLRAVDLFRPAPLEVIEGFEHGEARIPDTPLDAAVLPHRGLALNQLLQIIQMRALLLGRVTGNELVVEVDADPVRIPRATLQASIAKPWWRAKSR
jgi:hypothetical protein